MRIVSIVLGLSLASTSYAQSQADDDERPGQRSGTKSSHQSSDETVDEAIDPAPPNTQPPNSTTGRAPADTLIDTPAQPAAQPSGRGNTGMDNVGSAPLELEGKGGKGSMVPAHPEGAYMGVSLDGKGLPPKPPKMPMAKGPQRLTWPGFQVRDGVPTVFLQTTGVPDYSVAETKGGLLVTLRGTTIKLRNNQRPLKVAAFGTDVSEISAKPKGKDVLVTIRRTGSAHKERIEPSPGGFQLLVVELPQAAPAAPTADQ